MREPHPKSKACPVAPHAHPLARRMFELAQEEGIGVTDIAERAGIGIATLVKWKYRHAPNITTLEAALNVLGYQLSVVKRYELRAAE